MLKVDSHIVCQKCNKPIYTLYRVSQPGSPGAAVHRLWPAEGTTYGPPANPSKLTCPMCGSTLVREEK